jgi:hypothetical protein
MRTFVLLLSLAAIAAALLVAPVAQAQPVALTGKMAPFSYLFGTPWNCSTNVPAMGNMAAHTDRGTIAFEAAPGNVVHGHLVTADYNADFYYGFDSKTNMYWQTRADSVGGYGYLTSSDGRAYSGTVSMGAAGMQVSAAYSKSGPNSISVRETLSGPVGGTIDTTCTR